MSEQINLFEAEKQPMAKVSAKAKYNHANYEKNKEKRRVGF